MFVIPTLDFQIFLLNQELQLYTILKDYSSKIYPTCMFTFKVKSLQNAGQITLKLYIKCI